MLRTVNSKIHRATVTHPTCMVFVDDDNEVLATRYHPGETLGDPRLTRGDVPSGVEH